MLLRLIMKKLLEKIQKNIFIQFLWLAASLSAILITAYSFVHKPNGEILFDVVEQSELIPPNALINKSVQVFYEGENVAGSGKGVRKYIINVSNHGDMDILPSYFEPKLKWGIAIDNALGIDSIEVYSTGKDYFSEAIKPMWDKKKVLFNSVLMESGDDFQVILYVIYKKGVDPVFKVTGLIASTSIKLTNSYLHPKGPNLISKVFSFDWGVNLVRMPVFFILGCILVVFFVFLSIFIGDSYRWVAKVYRKILFKKCMGFSSREIEEQPDLKILYNVYLTGGVKKLKQFNEYIGNSKQLIINAARDEFFRNKKVQSDSVWNEIVERYNLSDYKKPSSVFSSDISIRYGEHIEGFPQYSKLKKLGLVEGELNKISIKDSFLELTQKTIRSLKL